MPDISVFCYYSCSVATDTFGLYCSVNRQDMKLDRVSVFWYSKMCRLRVKMQCNIQPVLCLYLAAVTKRNTLGWCHSNLLTVNCFCIELSGDEGFKVQLAGLLSKNYKVRRLREVTIEFANTPRSPSKYPPSEAMHRCHRLIHPSKQFWNWFCGMAFRAAVVLTLRLPD